MDCLRTQFVKGNMLNGRYETLSPLNHGSFGMVFMAKDCLSGNIVAVKCLTKPSAAKDSPLDPDSPVMIDDRSEELAIHTRIGRHPNIVNLLDSFETEHHNYLVLEYCSQGDLYEAIRQDKGPKQTDHIRAFMMQLVEAVEFLHAKGIFHRDIKPENIFLTNNGNMKLGDFGLATMDLWSHEASVGSDRYMAPEQYDPAGNGLSPARADIWSVGICLLNILFSRNPFGVPAPSDPLFADFVRDRYSLFDVFPNMSQDTFDVLLHCLALDPAKRSIEMVKEALNKAVSFTCDQETADDFCTDQRDVVTATANRQPLRTPSITSPVHEYGEFFHWAKHLHATPAAKPRQLSIIRDEESEDLFPGSEVDGHDWYFKADTRSIESVVDSGLGISVTSGVQTSPYSIDRSKPMVIGSVPTFGSRAMASLSSVFGKKREFESKSWSDMWDEEEEERVQSELMIEKAEARSAQKSRLSQLSQAETEDDGRATPRAYLGELQNPAAIPRTSTDSCRSMDSRDDHVSEHTGFVFDDDHTPTQSVPRYSPPKRNSLMDKWSVLGDRRRGTMDSTSREMVSPELKKRMRAKEWRRNIGEKVSGLSRTYGSAGNQKIDHAVWQQKEWSVSKDWRRSNQDLVKPSSPLRPDSSQLDGTGSGSGSDFDEEDSAIIDDDDWVGGWKDLHL